MVIGISAVLGDVASQEYVKNVISSCKDEQVSSPEECFPLVDYTHLHECGLDP